MKLFGKWLKDPEPEEKTAFTENGAAAEVVAPSGISMGNGHKILVVDDNDVALKTFELKLKSSGFEVITARDGSAAVSLAREQQPDLIVLDINFPPEVGSSGLQWDGFNIMEWMGRFREVSDIPVIVITSGEPAKFKARAFSAGAVAFFQKPVNHEEFVVAVRR